MIDEKVTIICATVSRSGVAGQWKACSRCLKKVYLSDSSIEACVKRGYKKENIRVVCPACMPKRIQAKDVLPFSAQQIREIKSGLEN